MTDASPSDDLFLDEARADASDGAAPAAAPAETGPDTLGLAQRIANLVRERRGQDLVLLDVRELVDYTDFFLVVTGQSARQNLSIGEHVVKSLKGEHRYALSKSGLDTGSWICIDMADVVVHVFDPETRAKYDLELLWADAPRIPLEAAPPTGPSTIPAAAPSEGPALEPTPKRRRRAVRQAAEPDADLANAPDAERPPEGEPEPEAKPKPLPPKLPRGKPRQAPIAALRAPAPPEKPAKAAKAPKSSSKPAPKTSRPATRPARTSSPKSSSPKSSSAPKASPKASPKRKPPPKKR